MKIKTFIGASMADVMRQIKSDLGDDAVIITSRTQEDGSFRVSAAIEEEPVHEPVENLLEGIEDPTSLFGGIHDYGVLPDVNAEQTIATIGKALQKHSLPAFLFDKLMIQIEQSKQPDSSKRLAEALQHIFSFHDLPHKPFKKPLMLVGQPGAGKTTTIAKLAARGVMSGLKISVITADTVRAGAVEQLGAFMRVLQLPLYKVNTPEELKKALLDTKNSDQILIDCPGLNAFDANAMKEMHAYIKVAPMDLAVTIPGGIDVEEAAEIGRAFAILGAEYLLPTRLDMSRRLGGLLAAADQANLTFIGMGFKPDIADGYQEMTAKDLAHLIMPIRTEAK
jgi:flagellar biosynthesis protein FlhF